MSDQLDDWRDYQRLKNVDRGEDFAVLREILRGPHADWKTELLKDDEGEDVITRDSGYFSRRSSKMSSRVNSIPLNVPESTLDNVPESAFELDFTLVAEGTPSTPGSENQSVFSGHRTIQLAPRSLNEGAHYFFDSRKPESTVDSPGNDFDPDLRRIDRVITGQTKERSESILRNSDEAGIHRPENPEDWAYHRGTRESESFGLDGMEQGDPTEWSPRRIVKGVAGFDVRDESDDARTIVEWKSDLKGSGDGQAAALTRMKRWTFQKRSMDETLARRAVWDGAADMVDAGEEAAKRRSFVVRSE